MNILGLFLALSIYFYLFSKFGDDEALAVLGELEVYFLHAKRGKVTIKRVTDLETLNFTLKMLLNLLDLLKLLLGCKSVCLNVVEVGHFM